MDLNAIQFLPFLGRVSKSSSPVPVYLTISKRENIKTNSSFFLNEMHPKADEKFIPMAFLRCINMLL